MVANYEDVFSQVRMWDTIIFNELLKDNIIVPMRDMNPTSTRTCRCICKRQKWVFMIGLYLLI